MGEQLGLIETEATAVRVRDACARAGLADGTINRYAPAIQAWESYCALRGESVWDATTATLLHWLDHQLQRCFSLNQLQVSLAAARHAQRIYMPENADGVVPYTTDARPRLDAYASEIARLTKRATVKQAPPLSGADLRRCVEYVRVNARPRSGVTFRQALQIARRNTAVLLVGWWGALRSAELAGLEWDDIKTIPGEGIELHLRESKTKKNSKGAEVVALAYQDDPQVCPVLALEAWRQYALTEPLYEPFKHRVFQMTRFNVSRIAKATCRDVGLVGYSAHSLRAGFATECNRQSVDDRKVMRHARWISRSTHDKYVRGAELWANTPTKLVKI